MKIPSDSKDLIAVLDKTFPHRCADPNQSDRQIWMEAGRRQLIDSLMSKLKEQSKHTEPLLSPDDDGYGEHF